MKRLVILAVAAMLCACGQTAPQSLPAEVAADLTQVFCFHTKQRCVTCNTIERLTREVVDSLADPKIVLRVVDITEQEALADRYQVTWSALVLDRGGRIDNLTKMGFSCARNQPQLFKARLVEALGKIAR